MESNIINSKDFKSFSDALSWMLTDILADEFYLEMDEFDEDLSTTEILACSLEKSQKLEQALLMLSTACQWADHGSRH
jgi:hypothetical protein|tara:strand:- start:212 stop:445 length:234 start_codon:yes stop_codon:yes gene_type:complete